MRNYSSLILYVVFTFISFGAIAQSIGFNLDRLEYVRGKKESTYLIELDVSGIGARAPGTLSVEVDQSHSTMPQTGYTLYHNLNIPLAGLHNQTKYIIFLTLKADSLEDRNREIHLGIQLRNSDGVAIINSSPKTTSTITLKGYQPEALNYSYLAYIGTNFDLVDGVKAKNLFFATNIYMPKPNIGGLGFYLSLYGNRAMTSNDTSKIRRLSRIMKTTDSTTTYFYDSTTQARSRVSDNLGASFSPLITLCKESNFLKIYGAAQIDFIWRRTQISENYTASKYSDSVLINKPTLSSFQAPDKNKINFNIYDFCIGGGFLVSHENKYISVRVQQMVGYSKLYIPGTVSGTVFQQYQTKEDIVYIGRAWITEATTGITLQAEITNYSKSPQPYYVVTLSKALNFKSLGTVFQPITSR